jgi:hypothetical protein
MLKTCVHCKITRPVADFNRNRHTRDGLSSWCHSCHVEATRAWRSREAEAGRRTVGGRRFPVDFPEDSGIVN